MSNGKDQIRFDIDAELKRQFQLKCVSTGAKMTPVLTDLVESWVNEENQADVIRRFFGQILEGQRPSNAAIVEVAGILKLETDRLLDFCDRISNHDKQPNGHA